MEIYAMGHLECILDRYAWNLLIDVINLSSGQQKNFTIDFSFVLSIDASNISKCFEVLRYFFDIRIFHLILSYVIFMWNDKIRANNFGWSFGNWINCNLIWFSFGWSLKCRALSTSSVAYITNGVSIDYFQHYSLLFDTNDLLNGYLNNL